MRKLYPAPTSKIQGPPDRQNWDAKSEGAEITPQPYKIQGRHALRSICLGLLLAALGSSGLQAQPAVPSQDMLTARKFLAAPEAKPSDASARKLWQISLITLSVANVLDVHSSLGKRELNPALAGPAGTIGRQGILLKTAFQGGLMGVEYLLTRSHASGSLTPRPRSKLYRALAIINFADTGVIAGIAAHNYTVPRSHP